MRTYRNEKHSARETQFLNIVRPEDDRYLRVACYLLAAINHSETARFLSPGQIDFTNLIEEATHWSTSEKALIRLVQALVLQSEGLADVWATFRSLDRTNSRVVVESLETLFVL